MENPVMSFVCTCSERPIMYQLMELDEDGQIRWGDELLSHLQEHMVEHHGPHQ